MAVLKTGKPIDFQLGKIIETSDIRERSIGSKKIYPSNSGLCARKSVAMTLLPKTATETHNITNQMYFKIGSAIEDVIVESLDRGGILLAREFKVKRDWKSALVSGRIDALVSMNENTYPVEIKSCGSKIPAKPRLSHLAQLETYMICTGMHHGLLVYVSRTVANWRGELKYRVFSIEMDSSYIDRVAEQLAMTLVFTDASILPGIPFSDDKECRFCPLIGYCWPPQEDKFNLDRFLMDPSKHDHLLETRNTVKNRIVENQERYLEETLATIVSG